MSVEQPQVEAALKGYTDPYLEKDLVSAQCVKDITVDGDKVKVTVSLGFPAAGYHAELTAKLKELVEALGHQHRLSRRTEGREPHQGCEEHHRRGLR
jgi:metal-sulfur cluster biosynthetic enzyme